MMNTVTLAEQIRLHKYNKMHFFSEQGKKVVNYIFGRILKYGNEFYEKNDTVSENTGVSVRTVQRTVKRMQELDMINVAPRRKVCTVTGKTVQSSNLIKLLEYKAFKVMNEIVVGAERVVEKVVEVIEEVKEVVVAKVDQVKKQFNKFNKKPVRVEIVPNWLGAEYVAPVEDDSVQAKRERLMKELEIFRK